jgi:hypothetical protein
MNRRLVLALGLLAVLAASAGCTSLLGSDSIDAGRLDANATYDWQTGQDVKFNVSGGQYQAVYAMQGAKQLGVFQYESLGEKQPVRIKSVQFQYRNGTVVGADHIDVRTTDDKTIIQPPAKEGKLAYTAPRRGKTFAVPTYLEDKTYEVVLPAGMRVDNFLLSKVSPSADERFTQDSRVHLVWNDPVNANSISVRYYLARDELIFGGIVAALTLVALLGLAYFRFQIRQLEDAREKLGLNVDTGDDFGNDGPPPGMK